jgi:hypothetical protein
MDNALRTATSRSFRNGHFCRSPKKSKSLCLRRRRGEQAVPATGYAAAARKFSEIWASTPMFDDRLARPCGRSAWPSIFSTPSSRRVAEARGCACIFAASCASATGRPSPRPVWPRACGARPQGRSRRGLRLGPAVGRGAVSGHASVSGHAAADTRKTRQQAPRPQGPHTIPSA